MRYFVFTSGEKGIHGLDWGIKHASEYFSDRQKLDTDYRALLKDFGLPPSLERPADEVGLILLSWDKSDYIAGFIFPGTDHGDRPNTSSVICVIPSELVGKKSVNETLKDVWEKNNIADIASKNSQHRPDTLRLEGDSLVENAPYFRSSVSWPDSNDGWLQIDGKQRKLSRVNAVKAPVMKEEIKTSSGGKLKIIVVLAAVAITFSAVKYFSSRHVESDNSVELLSEDIHEISSDVAKSQNQPDSKDTSEISGDNFTKDDKDSRQTEELRKKLTQLLAGTKPKVREKYFTVRFNEKEWDEEKKKLFDEIENLQEKIRTNKISLKPAGAKGKLLEFHLRSSVSEEATTDECIEAFLNQN